MRTYKFRFRFNISWQGQLEGDENQVQFTLPNGSTAILACCRAERIRDETKFCILSGGYKSENEALDYGKEVKKAVLCYGAKFGLGIDVGKEKRGFEISGLITDKVLKEHGVLMVPDIHGIAVYSEDHPISPVSMSARGAVDAKNADFFQKEVCKILAKNPILKPKIRLAMEILASSHFETTSRARFLALIQAAETLVKPSERCHRTRKLVDSFIEKTNCSEINREDKFSILGSLNWLRYDSISQSLQKSAKENLKNKKYCGLTPDVFIKKCYEARSRLLHSGSIDESKYNIGALSSSLGTYLRDLLGQLAQF